MDDLRPEDRIIDLHDDEWEVCWVDRVKARVGLRSRCGACTLVRGLDLPTGWSRA